MSKQMLSCDWGTSSFRLRLIDAASGETTNESISDEGIHSVYDAWMKAGADESQRMPFYLSVINRHLQTLTQPETGMEKGIPVIISGMASSSIGIVELPYTLLPFFTNGIGIEVKRIAKQDFFPHELAIVSGACTATDVMRGEETQLIGCAKGKSTGKQLFIFPGTHSKHVTTLADAVIDLKTYMTGELFGLLAEQSILAASIISSGGSDTEQMVAFERGVLVGQGQSLSHSLFLVRTNQLLNHFSKQANYHFLSGLLIGAELDELSKTVVDSVTLVGEEKLVANYLKAFIILGIKSQVSIVDAAAATIQGQLAIYRRLYA